MNYVIRQILLLLFVVFLKTTLAQEKDIKFENISLEQGLSQSSVYCILQDSKGLMWFGTYDGLNLYNGYKITPFRFNPKNPNSIIDNSINTIFEDRKHNLWIGTRGGLSKYDRIKNHFINYQHNPKNPNSLCGNSITSIYEDKFGVLWIGTDNGLSRFDINTNKFINYKFNSLDVTSISSNKIKKIIGDLYGNIWIATEKGLNVIKEKNEHNIRFKVLRHNPKDENTLNSNVILAMALDRKGDLWIGTDKGLNHLRIQLNLVDRIEFTPTLRIDKNYTQGRISSIAEDFEGVLWVGTEKAGLNSYNPRTKEWRIYINDPVKNRSLSVNHVLDIYQDRAHILWIGTSLGGINKWNRAAENVHLYRHNPYEPFSLSSSQIRTIYQDKDSIIWIGTVDGGLNRWLVKEGKFIHYTSETKPNSLSNNHIRTILEDSKKNFWVGTDGGGLNKMDKKNGTFKHYLNNEDDATTLSDNRVWKVYEDSKGRIWVATFGGGLNLFDPKTEKFKAFKNIPTNSKSISNDNVTTILENKKGQFWVGTLGGGLNKFDPEKGTFICYKNDKNNPHSIGDDRVYSIVEDENDILWIGTKGNLNKCDTKTMKFTSYSEENGFPNNVMMGILDDLHGNLWISTNGGLTRFNKKTGNCRNFDAKDGLQSNEFLVGSYCKSYTGEMFFGGINGFNTFYPEKLKDNPNKPPIVITGFQIFNKEIALDTNITEKKIIELEWQDNVFSFDFVALDYVFPEKNQYAYKLDGLNNEWIPFGTRRYLSFTSLPAGKYKLRIKGSNNDGIWNEKGTAINIIIHPPFWKTTEFYIFIIALITASIYVYIKWREKKLQMEKRKLEQTVEERTHELREQRDIVTQQKKEMTDSIEYASRIQTAILPPVEFIKEVLPEHFVLYKPRDIVSGDFYWMTCIEQKLIIVAADCTGHGVPGAFMSMLGISFLSEIVNKMQTISASEILTQLRSYVKNSLHQTGKDGEAKDGMDISLCVLDKNTSELQFAGAFNPMFLIRKTSPENLIISKEIETGDDGYDLIEVKADKMPIGIYFDEKDGFTNNILKVQNNDIIYLFSDGYMDQFGGTKGKKFYLKNFKKLFLKIHKEEMQKQKTLMDQTIEEWRGSLEQVDDILVMGFRIKL